LLKWVHEGRLSAHVDAIYPFERAVEAFAAIGARKVKGKVLLKPKV
jgi:NADPH:quinone reductase-like Zn-dependent oxidoreductase